MLFYEQFLKGNLYSALVIILFTFPFSGTAQNQLKTISSIEITGNKHTKDKVILRELEFSVGDEIKANDLICLLDLSRNQIMKTGLFTKVIIVEESLEDQIALKISVNESLYILPIPVFKLLDRNINDWIRNPDAELRRVNLGLKVYHTNLSGTRDYLKAVMQFGYSQRFSLAYRQPFMNSTGNLGYEFKVSFDQLRDGTVNTINDLAVFLDPDGRTTF